MKKTKLALFHSVIALLLCFSMLVGTTFAWFTDSVSSGINQIAAGNLDIELYHSNAAVTNRPVDSNTKLFMDLQGKPILWEPGVVSYENLRVSNAGDLALAYRLAINTANENFVIDPATGEKHGLSEVLKVGVVEGGITAADRAGVVASVQDANWTTLASFLRSGSLLPQGKGESEKTWGIVIYWEPGENDNLWNLNNGKKLSEGEVLSIDLGIKLVATQYTKEQDSFGDDYDEDSTFPALKPGSVTVRVKTDEHGVVTEEATAANSDGTLLFRVPVGVKVASGVTELSLSVSEMTAPNANITLEENEIKRSVDVHVDGVHDENTVPMIITVKEAMMPGLNMGNYDLFHVEQGGTNKMTYASTVTDLDVHNEFSYDPVTGDVTLAMAAFSEVTVVADTVKAWEGNFDYSWYNNAVAPLAENTEADYIIANADQLAAFGAIVGGMNGQTQDSFTSKTVKLIADINLGDKESENNPDIIFYPIGYYNSEGTYERTKTAITSGLRNFEGTFDGNGHTIANFYQNTWEMKGDHDWYAPEEQYYRDGMGLFGRVYGGTIKNLSVKDFSSDGEIATTGCIAAYADGATFENIAIINCNPRVYNIGNGGIVGCVGWYAKEANLKTTFENITVDNSNKISALWGSYDVACGGIVGQYYPISGQTSAGKPANAGVHFENCHVSAQMDVYNDVCANYQYYAYRYTGMMIGSIRENETIDGHVYPKMDGITAKGCTVHFGDWNDYYYCELVANSKASYTHDHQMSRLEQVASVDVANKTVTSLDGKTTAIPASGRVNYVVVKAKDANGAWIHGDGHDYAECYHFVNGVQHFHDVADADNPNPTETVNGVEGVLKEDKQLIYREFNQLFTGYGWGVTSKGLTDYTGVENMDITQGEHEASVEKFESEVTELANNKEYKLGDIFSFVDNGVKLIPGALTVTVTNLDEKNPVSATFERDATSWDNGTLTLSGTGMVQITIQDYYFCTPTTITVDVTERQSEAKFETKFTGDFLYRVGNQNEVKLDSLFKAKDGVTIGTVSVTVEPVEGTAASGTYTSSATWTNGTIRFSNTGVVKVTITDNDYCTPTVLYLEVVDAVNATSATNATSNNVVLLKDISGGFTVSNGYAFYGNGFKVTCSGKGYRLNVAGMYGGFIEVTNGGVLDNVQVFCDIYPAALLYSSEAKEYKNDDVSTTEKTYYNYQLSAVAINGNGSMITNSYIYGGRNNIYVGDGNVTISNTTTKNGVLANIQIKSSNASTVTLKDVTTIQVEVKSTYDSTKTMLGCGILVGDVTSVSNPQIIIAGDWNHYNWVTATNATNTSNTYAQEIINKALSQNNYVHTNANNVKTVNLGMIVLNTLSLSIDDQRTVKDNYSLSNVTMTLKDPDTGFSGNVEGQVYSVQAGKGDPNSSAQAYTPTQNLEYKPTATKDSTVAGSYDSNNGDEDTRYCYWDGSVLKLSYVENEGAFALDVAELVSFAKFGYDLQVDTFTVTKNGVALTAADDKVTFTDAGSYVITYIVTDPYNYNKDGSQVTNPTAWTFTFDVEVSVVKSNGKNAEINVTSTSFYGNYGKTSSMFDPDFHYCIPFMKDVTITDYAEDGVTASQFEVMSNIISITVDGDKTSGTVTFQYLDGRKLVVTVSGHSVGLGSSGNTISVKSYNNELWICTDGVSNNATTGTWKVASYVFTGNNGVAVSYTTARTCNFDSASTTNSPQTSWSSFGSPSVDSIQYTVIYNANGGSCAKTEGYTTSSSKAVTLPTPSRSGYIFAGWYTAASGGTRVGGAGDSYTPSANITLYAQWGKPCTVTYNANGGSCGTASEKYTGTALTLPTPTRDGYWFIGWYDAATGGNKIGDAGATYTPSGDTTLYAHWQEKIEYTVTYNANGGTCGTASATYQGTALTLPTPTRTGYKFLGWYTATSGGTKIGDAGASFTPSANITLYAQWEKIAYTITVSTSDATVYGVTNGQTAYYGDTITFSVETNKDSLDVKVTDAEGNTVTTTGSYTFTMPASNVTINATGSCVTPDTLITLADGTQVRVDFLKGDEMLLVWNMETGKLDSAPILFVDSEEEREYEIIHLYFSDGTDVKVISEHGFWDYDLNKYVYLDRYADKYIGHTFAKQNGNHLESVQLVNVVIEKEITSAWSPVTAGHLCYFVNGMLSMPGGVGGLFNIFDVDAETMTYDQEAMQKDIETYGLFTYEELNAIAPLSEDMFHAAGGAYLKVSIGKGNLTMDELITMINRYSKFFL